MTTTIETVKTSFQTIVSKIENNLSWLKTKVMHCVSDVTSTNDTITVSKLDGTTSTLIINNVASSTKALQDGGGNVITSTYATKKELQNVSDGLIKVVDELPTENISTSTFYLKANDSDETENIYNEYIYVKKNDDTYQWEMVGQKKIDLSGYSTTQQTFDLLDEVFTSATITELL